MRISSMQSPRQNLVQRQFVDDSKRVPDPGCATHPAPMAMHSGPPRYRDGAAEAASIGDQQLLRHRGEAGAMVAGRAQGCAAPPDARGWRSRRWSASHSRVAQAETLHRAVAHDLGDDRGGGDRQADSRRRRPRSVPGRAAPAGWLPSTSARSGAAGRRATARHMASSAACRMFSRSISATEAAATAISARPTGAERGERLLSRWAAVSFFESSSMRGEFARHAGGKIDGGGHAPGPASGPRPTSSTPATRPPACRSSLKSGMAVNLAERFRVASG